MLDKIEGMDFSKFLKEANGDIRLASKRYNEAVTITMADLEDEIMQAMSREIAAEIDRDIINDLLKYSNEQT